MFKFLPFVFAGFVAAAALLLPAPLDREKLITIKGQEALDNQIGSSLSQEQIEELIYALDEMEPTKSCTYTRQKLLEYTKVEFSEFTTIASYIDLLIRKHTKFCKLALNKQTLRHLESLLESPELVEQLFGEEQTLTKAEEEANEKVKTRLAAMDSKEAEAILAGSLNVSSDVAIELLKKIDIKSRRTQSGRFSFAFGSVGKLREISEADSNWCQVENLGYIAGNAMQFAERKLALALHMHNLAANQLRVCGKEGSFDHLIGRVPKASLRAVEGFFNQIARGTFSADKKDKRAKFIAVMAELKQCANTMLCSTNSKLKGFNTFYGQRLMSDCANFQKVFSTSSEVIRMFTNKKSETPARESNLIEMLDMCNYVPAFQSSESRINGQTTISYDADLGLALELGQVMGLTTKENSDEPKEQPLNLSKEKVAKKLIKHFYAKFGAQAGEAEKSTYVDNLKTICEKNMIREDFVWLQKAEYPVELRETINQFVNVKKTCQLLETVGFSSLLDKLNKSKASFSLRDFVKSSKF